MMVNVALSSDDEIMTRYQEVVLTSPTRDANNPFFHGATRKEIGTLTAKILLQVQ
jgi:hypothetical protein